MRINDMQNAAKRTNPDFRFDAHHRKVAEVLARITPESRTRLLLAMPPRFSKTSLVSCAFTDAFLDSYPGSNVMVGVSTDSVARLLERYSGKRDNRRFVGIGANIPALRASLVVLDDPITEQEYRLPEAKREPLLKAAEEHIRGAWMARLKPEASMVLVMTRFAPDDLFARLEAYGQFETMAIPATENDHSTWPEFWSDEDLHNMKLAITVGAWAAEYQQEPLPG